MMKKILPNIVNLPGTNHSSNDTMCLDDNQVWPKQHLMPKVLKVISKNHNFENLILNQRNFKGHPYLNLQLYLNDFESLEVQNERTLGSKEAHFGKKPELGKK